MLQFWNCLTFLRGFIVSTCYIRHQRSFRSANGRQNKEGLGKNWRQTYKASDDLSYTDSSTHQFKNLKKKVLSPKWEAVSFWVEIYNFTDVNINDMSYEAVSFWVEIYNFTDVDINSSYQWYELWMAKYVCCDYGSKRRVLIFKNCKLPIN